MKKRFRVTAIAGLVAMGAILLPAPAQAHYDPWRTHWHYNSYGQVTYKMCSWWDATFRGCKNGW